VQYHQFLIIFLIFCLNAFFTENWVK
jgi:hypothetical protein